eukprot:g3189.t1
MLSQQIILHAQDLVATNDQAARVKLARTVNAFEAAHTALMADAAREASLGHVYLSRTPSTDEIVRNYIGIARDIPYAKYPEALLDELKAKGSGEVLDRMSEAMIAFEAQVQIQAGWAQRLQTITLLLAVLVIVLEALLIFLPAHRTVDQAMQELRKTAETDPLTKLRNRAGFDKDTLEAMQARDGDGCALSLILFDLDDFKGINDRYGQAVGDAVLKRIGYRVSRLPNLLSAARVGGDEFAILVDSDHWGLNETKDRIAEDIQKSKDFLYHPVNHKADEFANDLIKQIKEADVRLDQVWIEVTETERLTRLATARDHLEALNQAGIRIALDDYGVGYSNIRRLAELPIQRLKIDKSIVDNVEENPKYAGVFRSSVQLARALGAEVVAEGVETAEQLVIVERFGCRLVQGYYFFKPMPIAELKDLFRDQISSVA